MNPGSIQLFKEAVAAGMVVTMLLQWAIQKGFRKQRLKLINVKEFPFYRQFSIVIKLPFQTKAQKVFVGLLQDYRVLKTYMKER